MFDEPIDQKSSAPPTSFGAGQGKHLDIRNSRIEVITTADDKVCISEPSSPYHSEYPWNNVQQTVSGHLRELDDTPGAERILEMHKSGTFYEIHPDGSKVTKIFGKDFYIVLDDHTLFVGGNLNITVEGNANLLVKGDMKQKINGNLETVVNGNMTTRVKGKTTLFSKNEFNIQTNSNLKLKSNLKMQFFSASEMKSEAQSIKIRSNSSYELWTKDVPPHFHWWDTVPEPDEYYKDTISYNTTLERPTRLVVPTKDSGSGLTVSQSTIYPTKEAQYVLRTDNMDTASVINTSTTLPKDRTKNT